MSTIDRRDLLRKFIAAPIAASFAFTEAQAQQARTAAKTAGYVPKFFTAHEWSTVRALADIVIPKDDRSGSASDAAVPEFMDFILQDPLAERQPRERNQTRMRGGLAWLDLECSRRFSGKTFLELSETERTSILDAIAYPKKATPEMSAGVAFFNAFRDLTAAGFFSSKQGVADLQFKGNTYAPDWNGCPPEVLKKIGLDG